ncbi:hypothetical protein PP740_gp080 [Stenotrophomonas phage Philippe]|uniref:Uncharacterized protein n=1 Tax=Stenotrophomonas phage Philippe TaxID=2859655 RepID=A0AAE8BIJ1_9CAUD|nr:hypothetical protein PP740_gp080 [Stenotrophomonas phage Philippe]QYW02262.1 hypothetical protein CPT_Philippe_069 [Stenotrophomonas phage Philippe]
MTEQKKLNRYVFVGKVTALVTQADTKEQGVISVDLNALVVSNVENVNLSILNQGTAALSDTFMQTLPESDRKNTKILRVTILNIMNTGLQTDDEWTAKPVGYELARVEGEG